MSKLKRKRSSAEEIKPKPDLHFRIREQKHSLRIPDAALPDCVDTGVRSSWWTRPDLSEVEKLWLTSLQDLSLALTSQDPELCLPDLPKPPPPDETEVSEWSWCGLHEDVGALPDPPPPASVQSTSIPSPPKTTTSTPPSPPSTRQDQRQDSEMMECEDNEAQREGNAITGRDLGAHGAAAAGTSGVSGTRTCVKMGSGSGVKSKLGSRVESESGVKSGSEPDNRTVKDEGSKLECCPMCLMSFPAGFSQMECDGHLAQCLSDMNVDMVW